MASLSIDVSVILQNAAHFLSLADRDGLQLTAVTKFCLSDPEIVLALSNGGIASIADTNLPNFKALSPFLFAAPRRGMRKSLLKTRLSDLQAMKALPAGELPDRVFVSDLGILEAMRGLPADRRPEIALIVETGDLKEGLYPEEARKAAFEFADLPIIGVSTNFACLSGNMPDLGSVRLLRTLADELRAARGLERPFASVGGTVVYDLLSDGLLKGVATDIRIGEGIFFGYDSSGARALPGLKDSAFTLRGEILEVKEKNVVNPENAGHNALGRMDAVRWTGMRRRAVLDFGALAGAQADIRALEPGVEIAGQTYDYTVADVTACPREFRSGGHIDFRVLYAGASRAYVNQYVSKSHLGDGLR